MPLMRSALDTRYASWPITARVDITSDTAQVAFVANPTDTPTDWHDAAIVVDSDLYGDDTPRFRVLIGPENSGVQLTRGTWHILGKITDAPEVPVLYIDYIVVR